MSDWKNLDNELSVKLVRIGGHRSLPPLTSLPMPHLSRPLTVKWSRGCWNIRPAWKFKYVMRASVIDAERVNWLPFTAFFYLNGSNRQAEPTMGKQRINWDGESRHNRVGIECGVELGGESSRKRVIGPESRRSVIKSFQCEFWNYSEKIGSTLQRQHEQLIFSYEDVNFVSICPNAKLHSMPSRWKFIPGNEAIIVTFITQRTDI